MPSMMNSDASVHVLTSTHVSTLLDIEKVNHVINLAKNGPLQKWVRLKLTSKSGISYIV